MPEPVTQQDSKPNSDSTQQSQTQDERRKNTRYGKVNLTLSVARTGIKGLLRINPSSSKCLDMSLSGIHFNSNQKFTPDEKLVLDLCVRETELKEINAIVLDSQRHEDGYWCTRAKFCFQAKRMQKPGVTSKLLKIVDRIRAENEFPLVMT